ncbi:MAG: S-layer family protein [Stigonema ocellatum SAG 48.90 = DSM 106950]|nr:S-layer family protein [Stigonema ocellatum SAG 48.90 = DSM 106950]
MMQRHGGNTGNIHIQAGSLSLANDALLTSETYGQGNAGNILIEVDNAVSLTNYSFILNGLRGGAMGNGGKIDIHARSLTVTDSALSASTNNNTQGKAGNIEINADDFVKISGVIPGSGASAGLFTTAEDTGKGGAGDIIVNTNALSISNGAVLSARTRNSYSGGNITVNVKTLEATNGGQLFSTASSSGRAGDITINAASSIILSGSDPTYADRVAGFGLSNPISENSAQVDTDGSASGLFARSTGQGNAGNISVTVRRGNLQANNGNILTNATQSGGGNVDITARDIRLRNNSAIKTNSGGGNGGNITLTAKTIVALEDSDILSFAPKGQGGNITFNTRAFLSSPLYRPTPPITDLATLNALEKPNGRVDINASGAVSGVIRGVPDISFLQNSLTELPTNLIDTNNLIANSCIARNPQQKGSFIITGAGGLPSQPDDPANAPFPTYVVPAVGAFTSLPSSVSSTNSARPWKKGDPIVEPQGVYRLPDGHLVLSRDCRK